MKITLALAALGALALASQSAALASPLGVDASITTQLAHLESCATLLVTDPAQHAAQCGPSRIGVVFVHAGGDGCAAGACPKKKP